MDNLKKGDVLIANFSCSFPDKTTGGKEYVVISSTKLPNGKIMFKIIADDGEERFPLSTSFKKKES